MRKKTTKRIAAAIAAVALIGSVPFPIYGKTAEKASAASTKTASLPAVSIKVKAEKSSAVISWNKVKGAEKYLVYRYGDGYDYELIAVTDSTSYTDSSLEKNKRYRYTVYAQGYINGALTKSPQSNIITVKTDGSGKLDISPYDPKTDKDDVSDYDADHEDYYGGGYGYYDEEEYYDDYEYDDFYDAAPAPEPSAAAVMEEPAEYEYDDYDSWDYEYEDEDDSYFDHGKHHGKYYYDDRNGQITAGTLTAAEVNDNKSYTDFQRLINTEWRGKANVWQIRPDGRYRVHVTAGGKNTENALVQLLDDKGRPIFSGRTNNKGIAYVFTKVSGQEREAVTLSVTSADGKCTETKPLKEISRNSAEIALKSNTEKITGLDVMLMVDTTGSMSDELKYLQKELADVIERVSDKHPSLNTRVSVNFYRDRGDKYLIRSFDFTEDVSEAAKQLNCQRAEGGGDYPEAVHAALDNAMNAHDWLYSSTSIMFIVLDAPPHDFDRVIRVWTPLITEAAENGIRIIPVAASGTDTETEYLMRSAAVLTGGTYIYLTDDSGVGYSHKEASTSEQKEVKKLNDLMVQIIEEYIS